MGFFDDFTSKVSVFGQEAAKKAKELADIGRMNLKIGEEEKRLSGMFEFLGISLYEAKETGMERDFSEAIGEIRDQKRLISELKAELSRLKKCKICPDCGAECASGAAFCASCGKAFPADPGEDAKTDAGADELKPEFCPDCGARVAPCAIFCANCGKKF